MAKLVLLLEDGTTKSVLLDRERITIGRRPDNDLCLAHPAVSGDHAAVVTLLSDSFLQDLGSTNGTFVNGQAVHKRVLRDGDVIELGQHRMVYVAVDDSEPATPPKLDRAVCAGPEPDLACAVADQEPGRSLRLKAYPCCEAELVVLSGPRAGNAIALVKPVTSVGRPGVQVALVHRTSQGHVLTAASGSSAPKLNGVQIGSDGALLGPGDVIEVAGARIEFCPPPDSGP